MRDDAFYEIGFMFAKFINNAPLEWKIEDIREMQLKDSSKTIAKQLQKYESNVYNMILKRGEEAEKSLPKTIEILGVLQPFLDKKSGAIEFSMTCVIDIFKKTKADYMFFIAFKKIFFVNLTDDKNIIDCGAFIKVLSGGDLTGEEKVASLAPTEIKNLPGRFEKINYKNITEFMKYLGNKIGAKYEYDVKSVKKKVRTN